MNKNNLDQNGTLKHLITASIVVDSLIALIALILIISLLSLGGYSELIVYYFAGFVIEILSITSIIYLISRKYNIGTTLMIIAGVTSLPIGIIAIILGIILRKRIKKIKVNEEHKFLAYKILAKEAESKGQIDQAIDYYMESLSHLENDYENLKDKKLEEGRLNHIKNFKEKIEVLKRTKSDLPNSALTETTK
jgi:hypothetical protein